MAKQNVILSGKDAARVQKMLREWEHRDKSQNYRRRKGNTGGGAGIQIFEVYSAGTGDGIYNCYEQKLVDEEWDDTGGANKFANKDATPVSVEVLNLKENIPIADYTPALALYDRIAAWTLTDDEGTSRFVGLGLSPDVRRVRTTEAAPGALSITCNIILSTGAESTGAELGAGVEIWVPPGHANLDVVIPKLADDTYAFAVNLQGKWYFTQISQLLDAAQLVVHEDDGLQTTIEICT